MRYLYSSLFFFFNATATTEIYTLSLHDALPISRVRRLRTRSPTGAGAATPPVSQFLERFRAVLDRKSTRLNSSHLGISYAVFCLKKKKHNAERRTTRRSMIRRYAPESTCVLGSQ